MDLNEDLKKSLKVLKEGGILLYPTDTVWGIGCDASNISAVNKIFSIKSREENKSLLILVNNILMLERYVKVIPETARKLIEISDSPLTIVYSRGINLAQGVCNSDGSIGVRICKDAFCSELIGQLRKPLVSTSANISGQAAPANFSSIDERIIKSVDYVVEHRRNEKHLYSPSPIIKVEDNGTIKILRR